MTPLERAKAIARARSRSKTKVLPVTPTTGVGPWGHPCPCKGIASAHDVKAPHPPMSPEDNFTHQEALLDLLPDKSTDEDW